MYVTHSLQCEDIHIILAQSVAPAVDGTKTFIITTSMEKRYGDAQFTAPSPGAAHMTSLEQTNGCSFGVP